MLPPLTRLILQPSSFARWAALRIGLLVGVASAAVDSAWVALNPGIAGANGDVMTIAEAPNGDLYVAGDFTAIGDVAANKIARWDGSHWSALGSGIQDFGINQRFTPRTLAVDSSGQVYVGGDFPYIGGVQTGCIARWNGTQWLSLGKGLLGQVNSLVVGDSGFVYATGNFKLPDNDSFPAEAQLARWDGRQWTDMGTWPGGLVLHWSREGSLYTCGEAVTRWTGFVSENIGATKEDCQAITQARDGTLYIAGGLNLAIMSPTNKRGLSRWDGTTWTLLPGGPKNLVNSLAIDSSGTLYAACSCSDFLGKAQPQLVKWDGESWSIVGGDVSKGYLRTLAIDHSDALVAGGGFRLAGDIGASGLARWDKSKWSTYGHGINGPVYVTAWDSKGRLYVGGEFTAAGAVRANCIAMWDGHEWAALGSGVERNNLWTNSVVRALAVDSLDNVYVGGTFESAGGVSARSIAMWNGAEWNSVGTRKSESVNESINALVIDANGHLFAGGYIDSLGGVPVRNIGVWDGSSWKPVGKGLDYPVYTFRFDAKNRLIAGTRGVSRFDDTGWTSLSGNCDGNVTALGTTSDGQILAGGEFTRIGNVRAPGLAILNGESWEPVSDDGFSRAGPIAVDRQGNFLFGVSNPRDYPYNTQLNNLDLNGDLAASNGRIETLSFDPSDNLAIGGSFVNLHSQSLSGSPLYSPYLALLRKGAVGIAPRRTVTTKLEGKPVQLEAVGLDGRRGLSVAVAAWSRASERAALRSLGRGTWLVRRILTGSKSEASLVVVP